MHLIWFASTGIPTLEYQKNWILRPTRIAPTLRHTTEIYAVRKLSHDTDRQEIYILRDPRIRCSHTETRGLIAPQTVAAEERRSSYETLLCNVNGVPGVNFVGSRISLNISRIGINNPPRMLVGCFWEVDSWAMGSEAGFQVSGSQVCCNDSAICCDFWWPAICSCNAWYSGSSLWMKLQPLPNLHIPYCNSFWHKVVLCRGWMRGSESSFLRSSCFPWAKWHFAP